MKCEFCKKEVDYLYTVQDEDSGKFYQICGACSEEAEIDDIGEPDVELCAISITMDSTMLDVLERQAETEGFINVEAYARGVLFQLAVAAKLEDLGDVDGPEEEAAFTQEMRRWLIME